MSSTSPPNSSMIPTRRKGGYSVANRTNREAGASPSRPPAVPALERVLDILEYLGGLEGPATLKELSKALDIPPASAFRIVRQLTAREYLKEYPGAQSRFGLGFRLLTLSRHLVRQLDPVEVARPVLKTLSARCGQTAQLGLLQRDGVLYVDQVLPLRPVSIIAPLRTVIPVNLSASAKVLLAFLPDTERREYVQAATLEKRTARSLLDRDAFLEQLDRVRLDGYAVDIEEFAIGIGCLAAPVFDHAGVVTAALGITGHVEEYLDPRRFAELAGLVREAARDLSARLGARD